MSEEPENRSFERWALVGACTLALVGIAAFWARRDPPGTVPVDDERAGADLVRVRIGGERPPRPEPDQGGDDAIHSKHVDPGPAPDDEGMHTESRERPDESGPSAPPPPRSAPREVTVRAGETLGEIAERELGTVTRLGEILELNGLEDPDHVQVGTVLLIPAR